MEMAIVHIYGHRMRRRHTLRSEKLRCIMHNPNPKKSKPNIANMETSYMVAANRPPVASPSIVK